MQQRNICQIGSDSYRTSLYAPRGQSFAVRQGRILESCYYLRSVVYGVWTRRCYSRLVRYASTDSFRSFRSETMNNQSGRQLTRILKSKQRETEPHLPLLHGGGTCRSQPRRHSTLFT